MNGYIRSMVVKLNVNWTVGVFNIRITACASGILLHTLRSTCYNFLPHLVLSQLSSISAIRYNARKLKSMDVVHAILYVKSIYSIKIVYMIFTMLK